MAGRIEQEGAGGKRGAEPDAPPADLAEWVTFALDCDAVQEMGGTFSYPDTFSPGGWAALRGLYQGRSDARRREQIRSAQEAERQAAEQKLRGVIGTRR